MPFPAIRLGLDRVRRVLEALGHPEDAFASVLVAGTNGKGSVCALVESALRAAGHRTGLYTSPHLLDVRERVRVDGRKISRARWRALLARAVAAGRRRRSELTEFEAHTLAAFQYFREARVEIAVVEVGLGGRLDATNALPAPEVSVVASIGRDHREWLGRAPRKIYFEKRGVARPGALLVQSVPESLRPEGEADLLHRGVRVWTLGREVRARFGRADWRRGVQSLDVRLPGGALRGLRIGLMGPHQTDNAALAAAVCHELRRRGWRLGEDALRRGFAAARWPARLQIFPGGRGRPDVLLDGAHNAEAAEALARAYRASPWGGRSATLIFGCLRDKDAGALASTLAPLAHRVILTPLPPPRGRTPEELAPFWRPLVPTVAARGFADAWRRAAAEPGAPVLIAGSLYLAGQALKFLERRDA